jgi:hypothetical protein
MQTFDAGASKVRHQFENSLRLCAFSRQKISVFFRVHPWLKSLRSVRSLRLKMNLRPAGRADLEIGAPI